LKELVQKALHCRCGREKVLAHGLCATCYTLKRQDEEYFGGLREQVLKRDGYYCRVCNAAGRGKRSIVVHHRRPGISLMHLMISLCPACHAIVTRTRVVRRAMSPLLLELWQEQHPDGQVQSMLEFAPLKPATGRNPTAIRSHGQAREPMLTQPEWCFQRARRRSTAATITTTTTNKSRKRNARQDDAGIKLRV
jgi:hypothetical protein